jgi:hypothetical protein
MRSEVLALAHDGLASGQPSRRNGSRHAVLQPAVRARCSGGLLAGIVVLACFGN